MSSTCGLVRSTPVFALFLPCTSSFLVPGRASAFQSIFDKAKGQSVIPRDDL